MTKQTMKRELEKISQEKGRTELPSVLLCAAECSPFAKTGGLADVVGTLPGELRTLGLDARVILPFHHNIKDKYRYDVEHLCSFAVDLGWRSKFVGVERLVRDRVTYYFIDNEDYFGGKIYLGGPEEIEQYCFFCRAVMEALPHIGFIPDILHCNDWHTAMLPVLQRTQYGWLPQGRSKTVLTIHNIAFQGKCGFKQAKDLLGIEEKFCTPEFLEAYGCCNFLKGGCVFADHITTVSPTYAQEILTPTFSEGLDGILNARRHQLTGILNGIDRSVFNPWNDECLPFRFSASNLKGKAKVKSALLQELGLEDYPGRPLIAMVTRLTEQKGLDLVMRVLDDIMAIPMNFVLLGSGDAKYEEFFRQAENRYKGRLCAYIGYNEELAHRIYAGSDFFLMPSRFEPCGLSQMIAMRYGSLPIVRETGGLKDTVNPYNQYTGEGTGFTFANYNAHEMAHVIHLASTIYPNKEIMDSLILQAMRADYGFANSAYAYAQLFLSLL